MRFGLQLIASLALVAVSGCVHHHHHSDRPYDTHQQTVVEYRYGSTHPVPAYYGDGWCGLTHSHVHEYTPADSQHYVYQSNTYYYRGPTVVWYHGGHHDHAGKSCNQGGRHWHDYGPAGDGYHYDQGRKGYVWTPGGRGTGPAAYHPERGTPPGHGGTPPGHGGTPPGHGGTPPGHGGTPPGHGGTPPGHGGTPPGHAGNPPGHGGTPPGLGRYPPGLTRPEHGGNQPGQGAGQGPPGHGAQPPGHGGQPPGKGHTSPPGHTNNPGHGATKPGNPQGNGGEVNTGRRGFEGIGGAKIPPANSGNRHDNKGQGQGGGNADNRGGGAPFIGGRPGGPNNHGNNGANNHGNNGAGNGRNEGGSSAGNPPGGRGGVGQGNSGQNGGGNGQSGNGQGDKKDGNGQGQKPAAKPFIPGRPPPAGGPPRTELLGTDDAWLAGVDETQNESAPADVAGFFLRTS